jgi:hypothetical protein
MNTFMIFLIMSEKIDITHHWKEAGALHNPNDIRWYAYVPYGHMKVVLLWSFEWIGI